MIRYEVRPVYPEPRGESDGCSRRTVLYEDAVQFARAYWELIFAHHSDVMRVHIVIQRECRGCGGSGRRPDRPRQIHVPCNGSGISGVYASRYATRSDAQKEGPHALLVPF